MAAMLELSAQHGSVTCGASTSISGGRSRASGRTVGPTQKAAKLYCYLTSRGSKMKSITVLKFSVKLLTAAVLTTPFSAYSGESARKVIAPTAHPLAKIIVQVSQVGSTTAAANGFVVGGDGCHVLTNFHVAFGKGKTASGDVEWVKPFATGHPLDIKLNLKADGTFNKQLKGRVIEYGAYDHDDLFGRSNDLAMVKLDECLGKEYGIARFEMPDRTVRVPQTAINTLSLSQVDASRSQMYLEERCVAAAKTPINGLFFQSCEAIAGMSGSPIFRNDADGGYTIVGMSSGIVKMPGEQKINYAIYSSLLTPFVESVLGNSTIKNR
jgi:hypothetical protein